MAIKLSRKVLCIPIAEIIAEHRRKRGVITKIMIFFSKQEGIKPRVLALDCELFSTLNVPAK